MSDTERDLEVAEILAEALRAVISIRDRADLGDDGGDVRRAAVLTVDHLNGALSTLLHERLHRHGMTFGSMSFFELLPRLRAAEDESTS
jgi:hypothetical protein